MLTIMFAVVEHRLSKRSVHKDNSVLKKTKNQNQKKKKNTKEMKIFFKAFVYLIALQIAVEAFNPARHTSLNYAPLSTYISPEIVRELKDFENLIPPGVIDLIVAKHYLVDENFRIAMKYLRSLQFSQLLWQVSDMPEVLVVLEYLHLTEANSTARHMQATTLPAAKESIAIDDGTTTNTGSIVINTANTVHNFNSIDTPKGTFNNEKTFHKRPPPPPLPSSSIPSYEYMHQYAVIGDEAASSFNVEQPLVSIVLLEDSVVESNSNDVANYNEGHHHQLHARKYHRRRSYLNNYYHSHHPHHYHRTLGTFTTFVAEILQHLPLEDYQNMIKEKCQRSAKFAAFYHALKSPDLKPLIELTLVSF